jgi:hypothetical protein
MSRYSNETTVLISGRWIAETDKAVRFRVDKIGDRAMLENITYWFPLSQVSSLLKQPLTAENYKEQLDTLRVKEWLVIKNGLYDKLVPAAAAVVKPQNVYGSRVKEVYSDEDFEDDIPF